MTRKLDLLLVTATLTLAVGKGLAQSNPTTSRISSSNAQALIDQALIAEAQEITPKGQPVAITLKELRFQNESGDAVAYLRKKYGDQLAGIYKDYSGTEPVMIVRLVGPENPNLNIPSIETSNGRIIFEYGATLTHKQLLHILSLKSSNFSSLVPGVQGLSADEKDSSIHVELFSNNQTDAQIQKIGQSVFGVPVVVRRLRYPMQLEAAGSGTLPLPVGCTGAFIVKRTSDGTTGLLSAAHCGSVNSTYVGLDGTTSNLTYQ